MDIHLSDGLSLALFEKIDLDIPVIFTTAFSEYTLKAFKVNSIDYLLKPIGPKELKGAIDKFKLIGRKYNQVNKKSIKELKSDLSHKGKSKFVVKAGNHTFIVLVDDISCFFSQDAVTFLVTREKKKFPVDYSLEQLESLVSHLLFFRVNRQYLININFIEDIVDYWNSRLRIILKNLKEDEIIVSREKVQDFKAWLDK
jgi:DNA-binding LytR/AlgR family response regulator